MKESGIVKRLKKKQEGGKRIKKRETCRGEEASVSETLQRGRESQEGGRREQERGSETQKAECEVHT